MNRCDWIDCQVNSYADPLLSEPLERHGRIHTAPPGCEDKMIRVNSVIVGFLFSAIIGCSAGVVEGTKEQEPSRAKQDEDRKPSSVPTFTYRPGAGLMIEGH